MDYCQYQHSRDLAWKVLLDEKVTELPIDIGKLCRQMGIPVKAYRYSGDLLQCLQVDVSQTDGLATYVRGLPVIFYNDTGPVGRQRFTVAHELGHILAGDVIRDGVVHRAKWAEEDPMEQAANVFASRLLAPACVLWGLDIHSPQDIMGLCGLSYQAAALRARRLELLYRRERRFLEQRGQSCFLISPLEQQVFAQFDGYIRRMRS